MVLGECLGATFAPKLLEVKKISGLAGLTNWHQVSDFWYPLGLDLKFLKIWDCYLDPKKEIVIWTMPQASERGDSYIDGASGLKALQTAKQGKNGCFKPFVIISVTKLDACFA
jgi:hypothetical protein